MDLCPYPLTSLMPCIYLHVDSMKRMRKRVLLLCRKQDFLSSSYILGQKRS